MNRSPLSIHRSTLGHTLLEMLLSLVLLSIVMASVGSAVMFASQAVPDDNSPAGSLLADSAVLGRLAEDLASAQFVIELTSTAVTIVVPDRTGDSVPDRIRYAWSGLQGEALFYQLNDETAVAIIDAVAVFEMGYEFTSISKTLPAAIYLGSETKVASIDSDISGGDEQVQAAEWFGQIITPNLSVDALGFIPTRAELLVTSDLPADGQTQVALRDLTGSTPGDSIYASGVMNETVLGLVSAWSSVELSEGAPIAADETMALTVTYVDGSATAMRLRSTSNGSGFLETSDRGVVWEADDGKGLAYRLYGRELLMESTAYVVTQEHLTQINVSLQRVSDDRSPLTRSVRLYQAPPTASGFALAHFLVSPVGMDLNADAEADWSHNRGDVSSSALADGVWTCDGTLSYIHKSLESAGLIRVEVRMRSSDVLGPAVYGPYTFNERNELLPLVTQLRSDGNGGQELVIYNDMSLTNERLVLSGLPEGFVDVGLTLVPGADLVSIEINRQPMASLVLDRVADPGAIEPSVQFGSSGGVAAFGSARVLVGGSTTAAAADPALIELQVGGIGITIR